MLKEREKAAPDPESLAGLFGRARDEAGAWMQAEVALYRTIGTEKAKAYRTPVLLLGVALFLAHATALVLVATLYVGLAELMNPALAGLVIALLLGACAAIAAKLALSKLKKAGS